ncbi:SDR family NAD(P)-dependent oxidoreductase [Novosphingobium sp. 9U]|uniref:SDR family NAD(P)-dependent oxidoreductase n=1 Tax=Novosphingobium sp. 9U TaxID=2653158 RepID=UPI0012EF6A63|nr:SDR family NAD(P)-dependent oxidoreductase [Novosphingobium sp. 9U]VWX54248.1 putative 3-oxoacyl-(acyl-carrier-protein) reductase FabG [Novosphingobium sp. 9U]
MGDAGKPLADKVAIVTGAGQGIGEAIALGYAAAGAKVLITGRTLSKLETVAAKIKQAGGECIVLDAVAGEAEQSEATVANAVSAWGRVDVLVNNAHSFTDFLPLEDPRMEEHCKVDFQSAFFGSLQLMQQCFPHMRDQGSGSIINMGSSYGIRCEPGFLAYAASKEAIRTLTKTAAREWGKHGIRVNTILPSALSPKAVWYLEESKTYDQELAKVAMGRFGAPEDIAPAAVFLASDASNFITGQTIGVEGGAVML